MYDNQILYLRDSRIHFLIYWVIVFERGLLDN